MKKIVDGDLIELTKQGKFDMIVHGCNCFHTMGSGIAPQIADTFVRYDGSQRWGKCISVAREADEYTRLGDFNKLGRVSVGMWRGHLPLDEPKLNVGCVYIVNAYTQYGVASKPGDIVVDYRAVQDAFMEVAKMASRLSRRKYVRIGYPAIGAGLAGGDWNTIEGIIDDCLAGHSHTLVNYKP